MSFFYNYLIQFFYPSISQETSILFKDDDYIFIAKHLITKNDIQSVKLNSIKLKNTPYRKVDLRNLNNSQLKDILNVKLNHVVVIDKQKKEYEQRHPVLKELLEKFKNSCI